MKHGGSFRLGQAHYVDVDGDGRNDLVFQGNDNHLYSSLSTGSSFDSPAIWIKHEASILPPQVDAPPVDQRSASSSEGMGMGDLLIRSSQLTNRGELFNTRRTFAAVVVLPPQPGSSNGIVVLPDRTTLDVSASQTAGLQEAINYAADYGWDLFVYGAGNYSPGGTYQLSAPLIFPPLQGKTLRFTNVNLEFGAQVTDAAFVFDSCMMVDLLLTGQINAPSASYGVRINPQSLFPLDGLLGHGRGITDSRFSFARINARSAGIFYNGGGASSFYAGEGSASTHAGSCDRCVFETPGEARKFSLHNTSGSLDVLNPTGVVVFPPQGPIGGPGVVALPNGSTLDTTGTQTASIQEAINYAAKNNLDLMVYGRGLQNKFITSQNGNVTYPSNGFYQINSGLVIPSMPGRTIRMYNVTLNYGITAGSALVFKPVDDFEFELTGQIVASGNEMTGATFSAQGGSFQNNVFSLGSIVAGWVDVSVQTEDASISNNVFLIREALGAQFGLMLRSNQGAPIEGNYFRGPHVHGLVAGAVDFQAPNSQTTVLHNRFDLMTYRDTFPNGFGIGVGGTGNTVYYYSDAAVFLAPGAQGNKLIAGGNRPSAF
jgi:hypothetical protein